MKKLLLIIAVVICAGCGSGESNPAPAVTLTGTQATAQIGTFQRYSTFAPQRYRVITDRVVIDLSAGTSAPTTTTVGTPLHLTYISDGTGRAIAGWGYIGNYDSSIFAPCDLDKTIIW